MLSPTAAVFFAAAGLLAFDAGLSGVLVTLVVGPHAASPMASMAVVVAMMRVRRTKSPWVVQAWTTDCAESDATITPLGRAVVMA